MTKPKQFSLYPPLFALSGLCVGIAYVSAWYVALAVGCGLVLAAWCVYFGLHTRAAMKASR